jgi:phospholipid/cholesterol/gamma-HCH transport system substrate-binding protein
VATNLKPTLADVRELAPSLRSFFVNLGPLITVSKTGLPAIRDVLNGATPMLGSLGPFLEQLNPVLSWLSLHQQLIADFISNGAAGLAAKTTSFSGNGTGHYLRQFQPLGPETLSFAANRDPSNRGNTYPPPLWLADGRAFTAGGKNTGSFALPSWDCNNTGAPGDGSVAAKPGTGPVGQTATPACWVAPPLASLLGQSGKFPHVNQAHYSHR